MLCAVVLQFNFHNMATRIDTPICENENKKACKDRHFAFSCKPFVVVTVKTVSSRLSATREALPY